MKQKSIITVGLLAMATYFVGLYTDDHLMRMITKPIPIFAMLALLKPASHYNKYIFTGLAFSVIGDVLLETSSAMFVFGLAAFLFAHIAYITAFYKRNHQIAFIPLILIATYGIVIYWLLYPGLQKMAIPVLLYLIVILTMIWRAIAQFGYNRLAIYAVAGALLFVISDSIIAINKFYVDIPHAKWSIMITYWAAQSLIFYSAHKSSDN